MPEPQDGTCCACKEVVEIQSEETLCLKRNDEIHCVHWWEGHPDDPDKETA